MERPPKSYGHRLKLVEGTSPRGLTYHCTDKAGYIYSSPLKICRVEISCCDSVAALVLANCNESVAEENITAPANT
jgi:hypothetical protein